jgi:histidyl-tRNA synthetase
MIALFLDLFEAWGFRDLTVAVNSVGTPESRRAYGDALRAWLAPVRERLSADSQQRYEVNPLRVLDTKDERDLALLRDTSRGPLPRMIDVLDDESRTHWDGVIQGLTVLGIPHEVDHGLVRGLDYYTRTAFEVHDRSLGAQSTLGGGGRYDGLIEELGGPSTPGVGFSIGLDRALLVKEERGEAAPERALEIYLVSMDTTRTDAVLLARELRREFAVECDVEGRALKAQLQAAGKSGARLAVILGEDEAKQGNVAIKDLEGGAQDIVPRTRLVEALRERLDAGRKAGSR